jgi:hypothetical protein
VKNAIKRLVFVFVLTPLAFSLGVLADESIKPTGWWWPKISDARQLGYVEGFKAGTFNSLTEGHCKDTKISALQLTSDCILYRLQQETLLDVSTGGTLDAVTKFYALPGNLPVRWDHAVIISEAMVSGVPISEKDLEVIRQDDAKLNVP